MPTVISQTQNEKENRKVVGACSRCAYDDVAS
jgi:hypothetical protein